jgi:hypothetical protein
VKSEQLVSRFKSNASQFVVFASTLLTALAIAVFIPSSLAQGPDVSPSSPKSPAPRTYPKEIRGYKVERAKVEIKKQDQSDNDDATDGASPDSDALIQFGEATIARMTPLGITLEVPVTVAAVKQKGKVDFLAFEDMVVNDVPVTVEDYTYPFKLPTNKATLLPKPIRLFISMQRALLGALGEWNDSKQTWPVTGRVYVFGQFKKFIFKFKRVVPVELTLSLPNPLLKQKDENGKAKSGK